MHVAHHKLLLAVLAICAVAICFNVSAPAGEINGGNRRLICRGVEESGRLIIGQPGFGPHLISLFAVGPNPLSATHTLEEHLEWVNDPLHSYVQDGTGCLAIWAHPGARDASAILNLGGLAGIELHHGGNSTMRDSLWNVLLTECYAENRQFLWGYAADDTHSRTRIGLSWFEARLRAYNGHELKTALRNGAFYVSSGPRITDIRVHGRTIQIILPENADVLWLRAGQYLGAEQPTTIQVTGEPGGNHCLRLDESVRESELSIDKLNIPYGELKFIRAVVRIKPDTLAHTQPFRINGGGSVENPYPASGIWIRGETHNHTDTPPGETSNLALFRANYEKIGELAAFSTDYSYWESPYQWLAEDGIPQILSMHPDRAGVGENAEIRVDGVNFSSSARVLIGGKLAHVIRQDASRAFIRLPEGLSAGIYDVTVQNPDGFQGTMPMGFIVQSKTADNSHWRAYTEAAGPVQCTSVSCIDDDVYAGAMTGLYRLDRTTRDEFKKISEDDAVYAVAKSPRGELWASSNDGFFVSTPEGKFTRVTVGQHEKARATSFERWGRIAFDAEENLWAANRWGAGMAVLRSGVWNRLVTADGIPGNAQSAVACDALGIIWAGFNGGLYKKTEENRWEKVLLPGELADCDYVSDIKNGQDGSIWAAVTGGGRPDIGGVIRIQGSDIRMFIPENSELPSRRIREILVTKKGDVWFASDIGVAVLNKNGSWKIYTVCNSGLLHDTVLGLADGTDGSIWFATAKGICAFLAE